MGMENEAVGSPHVDTGYHCQQGDCDDDCGPSHYAYGCLAVKEEVQDVNPLPDSHPYNNRLYHHHCHYYYHHHHDDAGVHRPRPLGPFIDCHHHHHHQHQARGHQGGPSSRDPCQSQVTVDMHSASQGLSPRHRHCWAGNNNNNDDYDNDNDNIHMDSGSDVPDSCTTTGDQADNNNNNNNNDNNSINNDGSCNPVTTECTLHQGITPSIHPPGTLPTRPTGTLPTRPPDILPNRPPHILPTRSSGVLPNGPPGISPTHPPASLSTRPPDSAAEVGNRTVNSEDGVRLKKRPTSLDATATTAVTATSSASPPDTLSPTSVFCPPGYRATSIVSTRIGDCVQDRVCDFDVSHQLPAAQEVTVPGGSADHHSCDNVQSKGQSWRMGTSGPDPARRAMCAGCGGTIEERYYLQAVDRLWHAQCLTCSHCHWRLDSQLTCFTRHGQVYCKKDYYRLFAQRKCSRCHQGIATNELVMKARNEVFHPGCFSCSVCHGILTPGQEFGMQDSVVYCRMHFEQLLLRRPDQDQSVHAIDCHGVSSAPYKSSRCRKNKGPSLTATDRSADLDKANSLVTCTGNPVNVMNGERYGHVSKGGRQKRMRTSFKHQQLRTMKAYFNLNHNPDAKDLRQLAQKTGLSKRVLQVWFQNARAKFRRNMLKQQLDTISAGSGPASSSPSGADNNSDGRGEGSGSLTDTTSVCLSPVMSDISTSPSLSDLPTLGDCGRGMLASAAFSDLLTHSLSPYIHGPTV